MAGLTAKTADAIIGSSSLLLLDLRDELERTKALRFFVFMCRCPVLEFMSHALGALVALSGGADNRGAMVQEGAVRGGGWRVHQSACVRVRRNVKLNAATMEEQPS